MTFWHKLMVVSRISLLENLSFFMTKNVSQAIDQTFVISFHIIPLKIWYPCILIQGGILATMAFGLDRRFHVFEVRIMSCFILKVNKLLSFLYIHSIILIIANNTYLYTNTLSSHILPSQIEFQLIFPGQQYQQTFLNLVDYMQTNLKTFVSKFIEEKPVEKFLHLYIVDKKTGPYKTIQSAIDAAQPNSIIKISEGFYEQNLVIHKPLKIQPKDLNEQSDQIGVVLLANSGIAVHIKLQLSEDQCQIYGIKFSHSGSTNHSIKKQLMEHEHILNIFEHHDEIQQLESEFVNKISFNKMESIIVLIEKGRVTMNNCILSLNYVVKSCNSTIPAIWMQKDSYLHMSDSEVKGNQSKDTIGIVCKLGNLYLQNSTITNHRQGGIIIWGIKANHCKIIKNIIEDNSKGITLVGEQFKLKIISNSIRKNKIGIKIGLACQPEINRNLISENQEGIQINSAFPFITLNKIDKNSINGIVCRSYKNFLCKAKIMKNIGISGNKQNGILIEGQNNKSEVIDNHMIGFNAESGIKVENKAFPVIYGNKIYKNCKEGILVVQNSNAVIQKNEISSNIQCNISIGGQNSHHSLIVENIITDSPKVGIYVIYSGQLKIIRNDILNNMDGILLNGSKPQIRKNNIKGNKNNGVICQNISNPSIMQNLIMANGAIGVFIRSRSCIKQTMIQSNIIAHNEIDVGIQQYEQKLIDFIKNSNTISGQIGYPEGISCNLM